MLINDQKEVIEGVMLDKTLGNIGYHIPHGVWYMVKFLECSTVLFEMREGPYYPVEKNVLI